LREHRRQREGKYQREQQSELLLQHVFLLISESPGRRDMQQETLGLGTEKSKPRSNLGLQPEFPV
jgi:hypothetical protein